MIDRYPESNIDQIKEDQKWLIPLIDDFQFYDWEDYLINKMSTEVRDWMEMIIFEMIVLWDWQQIPLVVEAKDNDWALWINDRFIYTFLWEENHPSNKRFETIVRSFLQEKELMEIITFFYPFWEEMITVHNVMSVSSLLKKRKEENEAIKNNSMPWSIVYEEDRYIHAKIQTIYTFRPRWEKEYEFLKSQWCLKPEIIDVWWWWWESILWWLACLDEIESVHIYDQAIASMIRWKKRNNNLFEKVHLHWWSPWDREDFLYPHSEWRVFNIWWILANLYKDPEKKSFFKSLAECVHENDVVYIDVFTAHTKDIGIEDYNDWIAHSRLHYESLSEERVIVNSLEKFWIYEKWLTKKKSDIDWYVKAIQTVFNANNNIISSSVELSRDTVVWKKHSYRFDPTRDWRYTHKKWTHEKLVDSKRYFVQWEEDIRQQVKLWRNDEISLYFENTPFELVRVNKGHYVTKLILKKRKK